MSDTINASEILMNNLMTIDELVAWSILTIQFSQCQRYDKFKNADPDTQPPKPDLNLELAYAVLRTYAKHYNAKTLISDQGKPASDKYIDNLIESVIGSDDDDDDFEQ